MEKYASTKNTTNIIIYVYKSFSRVLLPRENQGVIGQKEQVWKVVAKLGRVI
jgi:hypothetical protein